MAIDTTVNAYVEIFYKFLKLFVTDKQIEDAPNCYDKINGDGSFKSAIISIAREKLYDINTFSNEWLDRYVDSVLCILEDLVVECQAGVDFGDDQYVGLANVLIAIKTESQVLLSRLIIKFKELFGDEVFNKVTADSDDSVVVETDCVIDPSAMMKLEEYDYIDSAEENLKKTIIKIVEEHIKAQIQASEQERLVEQAAAEEKRKAERKKIVTVIILGVLGVGLIILGIVLGINPPMYDSLDLPAYFMQEVPIFLAAIICIYVCFSVLRNGKLLSAVVYAMTFAAAVFMFLFLAFIVFIWAKPELFKFNYGWYVEDIGIMPATWATVLMFIGGIIMLAQCILCIVAEHRDKSFTLKWFWYDGVVIKILDVIITILACVFFAVCSIAFSRLDNEYFWGYAIFSGVAVLISFTTLSLGASDIEKLQHGYGFIISILLNCVNAGLFMLCALCVSGGMMA